MGGLHAWLELQALLSEDIQVSLHLRFRKFSEIQTTHRLERPAECEPELIASVAIRRLLKRECVKEMLGGFLISTNVQT